MDVGGRDVRHAHQARSHDVIAAHGKVLRRGMVAQVVGTAPATSSLRAKQTSGKIHHGSARSGVAGRTVAVLNDDVEVVGGAVGIRHNRHNTAYPITCGHFVIESGEPTPVLANGKINRISGT